MRVAFYPDPVKCIVLHKGKVLQAREWGGCPECRFLVDFGNIYLAFEWHAGLSESCILSRSSGMYRVS